MCFYSLLVLNSLLKQSTISLLTYKALEPVSQQPESLEKTPRRSKGSKVSIIGPYSTYSALFLQEEFHNCKLLKHANGQRAWGIPISADTRITKTVDTRSVHREAYSYYKYVYQINASVTLNSKKGVVDRFLICSIL